MSPRVTVVIATYDWSTVLPYSIGSVLGQSFADFELLVVGDGCTDDSESVVSSFGDPRFRWYNLDRNHGSQYATGSSGRSNGAVRCLARPFPFRGISTGRFLSGCT